jgi:hypothetical protein
MNAERFRFNISFYEMQTAIGRDRSILTSAVQKPQSSVGRNRADRVRPIANAPMRCGCTGRRLSKEQHMSRTKTRRLLAGAAAAAVIVALGSAYVSINSVSAVGGNEVRSRSGRSGRSYGYRVADPQRCSPGH